MTDYSTGTIINVIGLVGVSKGQVVAFNPATNQYIPAQPNWASIDNTIVPAPAAYVAGIVYNNPDISGNGQLLINGVMTGTDLNIAAPGEYYLAPNGGLSLGVPAGVMPIYCGLLTSDGNFIFRPDSPAYDGHRHTQYTLSGGSWTNNVYNDDNDTTCQQILAGFPLTSIWVMCDGVFKGNAVVNSARKLVVDSTTHNVVTLFCTNPIATVNPEVTAVAPAVGNDVVKATRAFGTVYLDTEYPNTDESNFTGTCITSIDRTGITTAPVVHQLLDVFLSGLLHSV